MLMPTLGNPEGAPYAKPARNGPLDACQTRPLACEVHEWKSSWSHDHGNSRMADSLFSDRHSMHRTFCAALPTSRGADSLMELLVGSHELHD